MSPQPRTQGGPSTRPASRPRTGEARRAVSAVGSTPAGAGNDLTPRQRRILEFLREWADQHGYPPSVREIGEAVGLVSPSSVAYQLKALERKGY